MDKVNLVHFKPDTTYQHIKIQDDSKCKKCSNKECLHLCPTYVFSWTNSTHDSILVAYKQCVECGACRLICDNIVFSYPSNGYGVQYIEG